MECCRNPYKYKCFCAWPTKPTTLLTELSESNDPVRITNDRKVKTCNATPPPTVDMKPGRHETMPEDMRQPIAGCAAVTIY